MTATVGVAAQQVGEPAGHTQLPGAAGARLHDVIAPHLPEPGQPCCDASGVSRSAPISMPSRLPHVRPMATSPLLAALRDGQGRGRQ